MIAPEKPTGVRVVLPCRAAAIPIDVEYVGDDTAGTHRFVGVLPAVYLPETVDGFHVLVDGWPAEASAVCVRVAPLPDG